MDVAALIFATAAHAAVGQKRKYSNDPYIVHPVEVSKLVASVTSDPAMIAAAYLHDTVEDTQVTNDLIKSLFGDDVASLVEMLTDVSTPEDGNRKMRKYIDLMHTAKASKRAKTIKLADLISNTQSIVEHDPNFAKVYLREKEALLEVLGEGDPTLFKMATDLLIQSKLKLMGN